MGIIKTAKIMALAGLAALAASCMPLRKQYIEPRIGMVAPAAEEQKEYNSYFTAGAAYGINGNANGTPREKLGLEASLDYFKSSAEYIRTDSFLFGVNATYPLRSLNPAVYLTGGIALLGEFSDIDIPPPFNVHDEKSETTFGLGVGANMRFDAAGTGDISTRLGYIFLPGSSNVKGMLVLTAGCRF